MRTYFHPVMTRKKGEIEMWGSSDDSVHYVLDNK